MKKFPKFKSGDIVTSYYNEHTRIIITDVYEEKFNNRSFHWYKFNHIGSMFGEYYTIEKTVTADSDDFLILVTDIFRQN